MYFPIAFKIIYQRIHQFLHGKPGMIEYIILNSGQTVRDRSDPHSLDIAGIVSRPARIVILSPADTVVGQYGKERHRHFLCINLFNDQISSYLNIQEIAHLGTEGLPQLLIASEIIAISCFRPQLGAGHIVIAVKQRQLQYFGNVEIAGKDIGLVAEGSRLHTAAGSSLSGILDALSRIQQFLDNSLRIIKGRLPPALSGYFTGLLQKILRRFPADLHIGAWLKQLHFIHAFQNQIADFVHAVLPVRRNAARIDVGKIRIGAAFL